MQQLIPDPCNRSERFNKPELIRCLAVFAPNLEYASCLRVAAKLDEQGACMQAQRPQLTLEQVVFLFLFQVSHRLWLHRVKPLEMSNADVYLLSSSHPCFLPGCVLHLYYGSPGVVVVQQSHDSSKAAIQRTVCCQSHYLDALPLDDPRMPWLGAALGKSELQEHCTQ